MDYVAPGTPGFLILILCLLAMAVVVNVWTFAVFGLDKWRAVNGGWRIPERVLLLLALLGGWPGAKAAQIWFGHKTRKQPFGTILNLIAVAQVLVAGVGIAMGALDARLPALDLGRLAMAFDVGRAAEPEKTLPRRFGPGSADW